MRVSQTRRRFPSDPLADIQATFGVRPTSGFRTQGHQNALVAQGLTSTRTGSHQRGDGIDLPTPPGMSKSQFIARLKRRYPNARVIPSNGSAVHMTIPGWGKAPDVSNSRKRYPG